MKLDPDYYLLEDDGEVGIYEPYQVSEKEPGELNTREAILIDTGARQPSEISELLPERLGPVVGRKAAHVRWYCPKKYKDKIQATLAPE